MITIREQEVRVRGLSPHKARRVENALASFLPCRGSVTISGKSIRAHGDLAPVEQRVRNAILAHL
ncbi:MAG: hypothetical protein O2816_07130 [Planctomycetota bacterium]|nr:hypothetical protein [Planctomycetota bacterium]